MVAIAATGSLVVRVRLSLGRFLVESLLAFAFKCLRGPGLRFRNGLAVAVWFRFELSCWFVIETEGLRFIGNVVWALRYESICLVDDSIFSEHLAVEPVTSIYFSFSRLHLSIAMSK